MIVLDTSVLSLAFRRASTGIPEPPAVAALRRLIAEDQPCAVPGIVLEELLSGVKSEEHFARLRRLMEGFRVLLAEEAHHLAAARLANACLRKGIAVSSVDCLIAALAVAHRAALLTTDDDFSRIARVCGLKLFRAASR